jgi:hypothetical protein
VSHFYFPGFEALHDEKNEAMLVFDEPIKCINHFQFICILWFGKQYL